MKEYTGKRITVIHQDECGIRDTCGVLVSENGFSLILMTKFGRIAIPKNRIIRTEFDRKGEGRK